MATRKLQSVYGEPAKKDIPLSNFEMFAEDKYDVKMLQFLNQYHHSLQIPTGFIYSPFNIDQSKSNDKYMGMEQVLMALCCIHHYYRLKININIYDIVRNVLCFGKVPVKSDVTLPKPIKARLMKYLTINNGAGNSVQVTTNDYCWFKTTWINRENNTTEYCNRYGRIVGVTFCTTCTPTCVNSNVFYL